MAALVCACTALALAGCGDSDDDGAGNGMPRGGLGEQRYERIEAVIDGATALSDFSGPTGDLKRACEALEKGDALLAALRRSCAVTIKLARRLQAVGGCDGGSCTEIADTARQQLEAYEALGKAVDAAELSGDCADAVRAPDTDIEYLEAAAKAFDLVQRALDSGSKEDAAQAGKLLTDAAEKTDDAPDPLDRLRRDCGGEEIVD